MVKTKIKKAVSLVLAAVMSLTAFMGIGATTAFAAVGEKADVYLVDYPRSGDTNNNGEWGHGNLNYMNGWRGLSTKYTGLRAMGSYSGNIAYCIEPGTGQRTGDTVLLARLVRLSTKVRSIPSIFKLGLIRFFTREIVPTSCVIPFAGKY